MLLILTTLRWTFFSKKQALYHFYHSLTDRLVSTGQRWTWQLCRSCRFGARKRPWHMTGRLSPNTKVPTIDCWWPWLKRSTSLFVSCLVIPGQRLETDILIFPLADSRNKPLITSCRLYGWCVLFSVFFSGNEAGRGTFIVHCCYLLYSDDCKSRNVWLHSDLRVFLCLLRHGQK